MSENDSIVNWQWIFADRLAEERKKRKLTQQKLAELLGKETATVSSWEQHRVTPPFEMMVEISNLFNCDLDYFTGRIDERTHDVHAVCEMTGLSEEAVVKLVGMKRFGYCKNALSRLIEARDFNKLISSYDAFLELLAKLKHTNQGRNGWQSFPEYRLRADGKVVMSDDDAVHHFMQRSSAALNQICEDAYKKKVKKDHIKPKSMDYEELISEIEAIEQEINYLKGEKEYLVKEILPKYTGEAPPDDTAIFKEKE